jgi:hypothetical protein
LNENLTPLPLDATEKDAAHRYLSYKNSETVGYFTPRREPRKLIAPADRCAPIAAGKMVRGATFRRSDRRRVAPHIAVDLIAPSRLASSVKVHVLVSRASVLASALTTCAITRRRSHPRLEVLLQALIGRPPALILPHRLLDSCLFVFASKTSDLFISCEWLRSTGCFPRESFRHVDRA